MLVSQLLFRVQNNSKNTMIDLKQNVSETHPQKKTKGQYFVRYTPTIQYVTLFVYSRCRKL